MHHSWPSSLIRTVSRDIPQLYHEVLLRARSHTRTNTKTHAEMHTHTHVSRMHIHRASNRCRKTTNRHRQRNGQQTQAELVRHSRYVFICCSGERGNKEMKTKIHGVRICEMQHKDMRENKVGESECVCVCVCV